jgi:hypothetical protein
MPHLAYQYDAGTGTSRIPIEADRRYRQGLWRASATNIKAAWFIHRALRNGPSSRGAAETMAYYGKEMQTVMNLTAPLVDTLEVAMPGFKQWLCATGFGNDLTMFKGFVRWAEARPMFAAAGDILPASKVPLQ